MKNSKSSVLFGVSAINLLVFIISFLKLITGDASDASQNYGCSLSIIAGIIIAILTIIEIVKQYKNYKEMQELIPFIIACFKKENGKQMFQLLMALFFSAFPVVIIIGILFFSSESSNNSSGNGSNNGNIDKNMVRLADSRIFDTDEKQKKFTQICKNNPNCSDVEIHKIVTEEMGIKCSVETVRANRKKLDI